MGTVGASPTPTATATFTPTATATATATATFTPTPTPTATATATSHRHPNANRYCNRYSYCDGRCNLSTNNHGYRNRDINTYSYSESDHGGWNQVRQVLERHGNHSRHRHLPGRQPWQDQDVKPPKFMYWVKVTATAGNNTFVISQSITTGNFNTQFKLDGGGNVFKGSDCKAAGGVNMKQNTTNGTNSTVTVTFKAQQAGVYYIAVKFQTGNVGGDPAPAPGHNRSLRFLDHRRARLD